MADKKKQEEKVEKDTKTSKEEKKGMSSGCKFFLIIFIILAFLALCGMCFVIPSLFDGIDWDSIIEDPTTLIDEISDSTTESEEDNYLGLEYTDVTISDYEGMNDEMFSFYENLEAWGQLDNNLTTYAENEDPESFFDTYGSFNTQAGELISQAEAMAQFMEDPNSEASNLSELPFFVSPVQAKKRSSMWYWVPIIGSLVKAKHKSIETSRAGVYNYLKNELDPVDQKAFLDEYGLNSVEDLRDANDSTVEKLARDPELRAGIDWTKVTTDLGKTAVETTVEGIKMATGGEIPNIAQDTVKNAVVDLKDGEMDSVDDEMPKVPEKQEPEKRVTLGVSQSVKDAVPTKTIDDIADKGWKGLSDSKKVEIKEEVEKAVEKQPVATAYQPGEMEDKNAVQVPVDTWDFLSTTIGKIPVEINDIITKAGKVTEVIKPSLDITKYLGWTGDEVDLNDTLSDKSTVTQTDDDPNPDWWDGSYPSCPFIYVNGVVENDLISVAKSFDTMPPAVQKSKQYTDLLRLDSDVSGNTKLKIREIREETSYIDQFKVYAAETDPGVTASNDLNGNFWGYRVDDLKTAQNTPDKVSVWNGISKKIYHGDNIDLDFSNADAGDDSILVIRLDGFEGKPLTNTYERPALTFKTKDSNGKWVERDYIYPREYYTNYALNTDGWFKNDKTVRIEVVSCHLEKYHLLDFVGLDEDGAKEIVKVEELDVAFKLTTTGQDLNEKLVEKDENYLRMDQYEWFITEVDTPKGSTLFVETTGYYVAH